MHDHFSDFSENVFLSSLRSFHDSQRLLEISSKFVRRCVRRVLRGRSLARESWEVVEDRELVTKFFKFEEYSWACFEFLSDSIVPRLSRRPNVSNTEILLAFQLLAIVRLTRDNSSLNSTIFHHGTNSYKVKIVYTLDTRFSFERNNDLFW